ncbi:MAG: polyphosphate--nucleotide phosphotransferase [Bacteroidetes bacterium]|nr:polyphosphate--nucleotide phosphotransferase [Bacteroidota bacterium]
MDIDWKKYRITSGKDFKISKFSTHAPVKRPSDQVLLEEEKKYKNAIASIQYKLYAENRQSMLIVLQGMDSSGKDSLVRHIMNGVNPQGLQVYSFKHPTSLELEHSYLWRHYLKLPEHGQITIFNRSHYENVLIAKVHPEIVLAEHVPGIDSVKKVNDKFWKQRYHQINNFEDVITQNGTRIVKFFLHLSRDEQRRRFLERLENKEKHWKFSSDDIKEREYWDEYQQAYQDAIRHTSQDKTPWYVIPADDKWFTHMLCGEIIQHELEKMNPSFPAIDKTELEMMHQAKISLEKGK